MKQVKCAWKYCSCSEKINKENSIFRSGKYYHPCCFNQKEQIADLRKKYFENSEKNQNAALVSKVFNTLIFDKKVSIDFLLFIISDYGSRRKFLTPIQMYGLVKNKCYIAQYEKTKKIVKNKIKEETEEKNVLNVAVSELSNPSSYRFIHRKPNNGFGSIFNEG